MMRDHVRRMLILGPLLALSVAVSVYAVCQIAEGSPWAAIWALLSIASPFGYHYARLRYAP